MRKTARPIEGAVLLDTQHTAQRYDIGTQTVRRLSKELNATIKIGSLIRHDIRKFDEHFFKGVTS